MGVAARRARHRLTQVISGFGQHPSPVAAADGEVAVELCQVAVDGGRVAAGPVGGAVADHADTTAGWDTDNEPSTAPTAAENACQSIRWFGFIGSASRMSRSM